MSLIAMAEEANRRYAPVVRRPRTEEVPSPPLPPPPPTPPGQAGQPVADALEYLSKYIPTEVLGAYIPAVAAFSALGWQQWMVFWFFLVATPVLTWLLFAQMAHRQRKPLPFDPRTWHLWALVAGPIAFTAYAAALPGSVFHQFAWFSSGLAVVTVFIAVVILYAGGIVDSLFQPPS